MIVYSIVCPIVYNLTFKIQYYNKLFLLPVIV